MTNHQKSISKEKRDVLMLMIHKLFNESKEQHTRDGLLVLGQEIVKE